MKVGDYVRTKYGITQFKEYETTNGSKILCMPVKDGSQGIFANVEDVIKSSPNIIDLIEVGDYVNGLKVAKVEDNVIIMVGLLMRLGEEDIKSIVTKEQFEAIKYEIK